MRYFEFNGGFPYYALIRANSAHEALGLYATDVSALEEEWWSGKLPEEVAKDDAKSKFKQAALEEYPEETEQALKDFETREQSGELEVLLIDYSLT